MPVIRIDQDVYAALQRHGRAFQDTPNDVLRRLLHIGASAPSSLNETRAKAMRGTPAETAVQTPLLGAERDRRPRTKEAAFRDPILKALSALGGQAVVRDVLIHVGSNVSAVLTAADREPLNSGEVRWENTAKWERKRMVGEGLLRADSPRGIWELTAEGRKAAQRPDCEVRA